MSLIIDGKKIAEDIRKEVAAEVAELKKQNVTPKLVAVLVGEDPASHVYVANKGKACLEVGMDNETMKLPKETS